MDAAQAKQSVPAPRQGIGDTASPKPDLDRHRTTIKRLFLDENRSLDEVMQIMKDEYGVVVSKKVYKTRLKRWNMVKNIRLPKDDQAVNEKALLSLLQTGHLESVPINGNVVDANRLASYLRRRAYPSYGSRRPHNQTRLLSTSIRAPDALYAPEATVRLIRDYLRGRYQDTIHCAEDLDLLREEQPSNDVTNNFSLFSTTIQIPLEKGNLAQALVAMRNAPAKLATLLSHQPSAMISVLCRFLVIAASITQRGPPIPDTLQFIRALRALLRFAAVFASDCKGGGLGLPASHPLVTILKGFLAVDEDMLYAVALKGWIMSCATFDELSNNEGSVSSFSDWLNVTDGAQSMDDLPSNIGSAMEDAVQRYEVTSGPNSARTIKAMWYYASYLSTVDSERGLGRFRNEKSFQLHREMLQRGVEGRAAGSACAHVASCYALRDQRELAQEYMWKAINITYEATGWRAHYYTDWLQDWLTAWGETEKLAELVHWLEGPGTDTEHTEV